MLYLEADWRSTQVGRRGAPAKGIGRVTGARVQIPPSPFYQERRSWYFYELFNFIKLKIKILKKFKIIVDNDLIV